MNNCHLWILKIYQVDIRNIHYPWYIDGIRKIYAKIYAIVYYVFCTVLVAIARFESPFFRHFKAIRSCACFVRSTFRYVSLKMMRAVGRHFGVVKTRSVARKKSFGL